MGPSANVRSVELLQRFHVVLTRFIVDVQAALGVADMEIRHVLEKLDERLTYWRRMVDKRREELAQAKTDLSFARAVHRGKSVGCVEQELAVHKAKQRLSEAEEKVAVVQRWQRQLPEILKEFEGPARGLSGFVETDVRQANIKLEGKIASIEAYLNVSAEKPQ